MARSDVHPVHRFDSWQVWPGSFDNPPSDGRFPKPGGRKLSIDKTTPVASMGSCFAREIKRRLLQHGYNYITEETHHPAAVHASAAWERLYNSFSIRQVFQYTFESFTPDLRWWVAPVSGKIQDPLRRVICYESLEEAEADFARHRDHSARALLAARVLIITLGLTEIWEDRHDGTVVCIPTGPYVNEGGSMDRYRFRVSRYPENLDNLEAVHRIMAAHNPDCQILVTVSPVHLWATFRRDCDVISASCNSKSTLRAAADEFAARHDNVHYFPAYEMATIFSSILGRPVFAQGRENFHVNKETVKLIMGEFFRFYGQNPH